MSDPKPVRIPLPGLAVALFCIAPVLMLVGGLTLLGTASRGFFERAPEQASLGAVMLGLGVAFALMAVLLVGVRSIAQQHLDAVLRAREI